MVGIPLLDHIIVGGDNSEYFSFANKKLLPKEEVSFETDYRKLDLKKECSGREYGNVSKTQTS